MKLLVSTGKRKEYLESRHIQLPANAVEYELANAVYEDVRSLRNEPNVTALSLVLEEDDDKHVDLEVTSADATGGAATTLVNVRFERWGVKIKGEYLFELVVFDDPDASIPAVNATFGVAATVGTVVAGGGTNSLKGKTDSSGLFTCALDNAVDETVEVAAFPTFKGLGAASTKSASVTFSA